MKRLFLFLCCIAGALSSATAQEVKFELSDGYDNPGIKERIEQNLSALLTEANRAYAANGQIDFSKLNIATEAQNSISMLWSNVNFSCMETEIVEPLLQGVGNHLQVRNIPLQTRPVDSTMQDDSYQEAVVDFDISGRIVSFYFAISNNLYRQVIKKGGEVTDMRRRQMILDYVEHFRTAYNEKDLNFLEQVFSDDAIIITGKVTQVKKIDSPITFNKVTYKTQNKDQYIAGLRRIFGLTKYIRVTFSEIKIMRHPTLNDYYGVLLRQGYYAQYTGSKYEDDGYLFLLWDFTDEEHPLIHVRTWQPYWMNDAKTQHIDEEEIFDISDFNIDI